MAVIQKSLIEYLVDVHKRGQLTFAIEMWRHLLAIRPEVSGISTHLDHVSALLNDHANLLVRQGLLDEGFAFFTYALNASQRHAAAIWNNLASCLRDMGRIDEALQAYRRALSLKPDFDIAEDGFLLALNYKEDISATDLARAHTHWGQGSMARWGHLDPRIRHTNIADPEKPLRIGLISGDFGIHPVGIFLVRILENLDRGQFAVRCYATNQRDDELTKRLRRASSSWEVIETLSMGQLASKIREDCIDILIDLAGHTSDNRLPVFAARPAPVQISWMGYPGPTGLPTIPYVIADRHVLPPGSPVCEGTKILYLDDSFVCFDPPSDAPPVSLLPAQTEGHLLLGCFSSPAKCSGEAITLWARLLTRLPQARLFFKYKGFNNPSTQSRFIAQFAAHGIEASRLEFEGETPYADMYKAINRLDLALDPFPFAGGLMSCLILWMGVPVLTLPGECLASRQGLSFLSSIGITETLATSADDFVEKAVGLAEDLGRLADLRRRLRLAMRNSPLCDGVKAASSFQRVLRQAWRQWCAESKSGMTP